MIINSSLSNTSTGTCPDKTTDPNKLDENLSFQYFATSSSSSKPQKSACTKHEFGMDQHANDAVSIKTCKKCRLNIDDRYIFNIRDTYWHEECLKCFQCGQSLKQKCYESETGALYCREDYIK